MNEHLIALVRFAGRSFHLLVTLTRCIERFPLERFIVAMELFIQLAKYHMPPIESQEHVINTTSAGQHGITDEDVESEEWMSRKEAWIYLGVVKSTLEAMINSGELPSYRKKCDQHKKKARVWLRRADVEEHYRQYTLRKGKEKRYGS